VEENGHKKGDVLGVAEVAAIMAVKSTARLIPLCHPLNITNINIKFSQHAEGK
jgi:cyclic pyranopterin phosphate synthase